MLFPPPRPDGPGLEQHEAVGAVQRPEAAQASRRGLEPPSDSSAVVWAPRPQHLEQEVHKLLPPLPESGGHPLLEVTADKAAGVGDPLHLHKVRPQYLPGKGAVLEQAGLIAATTV